MGKAWRSAFLVAAMAALSVTASAQAQTTIGQLPAGVPNANCNGGPYDMAPSTLAQGAPSYEAPHSGVITSWSTFAAAGAGQRMTFKVVRPFGGTQLVRGHDTLRALVPGQVNTFRTAIPVQQGDTLSLSPNSPGVNVSCAFQTGLADDVAVFSAFGADTPDGQTWAAEGAPNIGFRLNVQASILPPPRITAIGPVEGSVAGGTPVTISGVNFAEVQAVTFSTVPALSYTVSSEGQITAVAPPNVELTSRTVEVKTIAGRADSPQTFNYVGCFVPQLRKYKLAAVKKKLKAAKCALGKVKRLGKGPVAKGLVVRQSPVAGKTLPPGTKVAVTLKTKRR